MKADLPQRRLKGMHKRACSKHELKLLFFFGVMFSLMICCKLRLNARSQPDQVKEKPQRCYLRNSQFASFPGNTQTGTIKLNFPLLTYLLHGVESFLRSQPILQLIKKFPTFYGTRKFITVLKAPATCPYLEQTPSSPHNPFPLAEDPS